MNKFLHTRYVCYHVNLQSYHFHATRQMSYRISRNYLLGVSFWKKGLLRNSIQIYSIRHDMLPDFLAINPAKLSFILCGSVNVCFFIAFRPFFCTWTLGLWLMCVYKLLFCQAQIKEFPNFSTVSAIPRIMYFFYDLHQSACKWDVITFVKMHSDVLIKNKINFKFTQKVMLRAPLQKKSFDIIYPYKYVAQFLLENIDLKFKY